jgi:hypothetical protein
VSRLQIRPTLQVLALLAERRLLPADTERELAPPTSCCAASNTGCNTSATADASPAGG